MNTRRKKSTESFDWTIVKEALRRAMPAGRAPEGRTDLHNQNPDIDISVLINDVFGGEIIKTHSSRGWHFYNLINGEQVDLAGQEDTVSFADAGTDSFSVSPAEAPGYFEQKDYTALFLRFVTALEESFGLGRYQPA